MKELDQYQTEAMRTMPKGISRENALSMTALGLAGEAGEVVDLIKKMLYHGHDLGREQIKKELGDVLWYVATLAETLGISLEEIAECNIEKLRMRYPYGFSEQASIHRDPEEQRLPGF